jgi:transposase
MPRAGLFWFILSVGGWAGMLVPMCRNAALRRSPLAEMIDVEGAKVEGSPVKFIVSLMPEAVRSPSTSRRAKRRIAKATRCRSIFSEQAPGTLIADKAYHTDAIRADLKTRGKVGHSPSNAQRRPPITSASIATHDWIQRMFGHLKINRAIATRYDQLPDSFLAMLYLTPARYWIKFVHVACPNRLCSVRRVL